MIRSGCFRFVGQMEDWGRERGKGKGERLDEERERAMGREGDAYRHVGLTADVGLC